MKKIASIILSTIILFLSGCTKQKIKLEKKFNQIEHSNKYSADFSKEINGILLAVQKFNSDKSINVFGTDILACGYQPIQITVRNLSNETVYLSPTNINLNLVSPKKVAKRCHWKTGELVCTGGVAAAIFYWPALIPTFMFGYNLKNSNAKVSKKIICENVIQNWDIIKIRPCEVISRIVFVENNSVPEQFLITLFCKDSKNALDFEVGAN